jgi:hypothetical protein
LAKRKDYVFKVRAEWPVTMVHNTVLADNDLTIYEKMTYTILCLYANRDTGECWPSFSTLETMVCCSRPMVARSLKKLEEYGYIKRQKLTDEKGTITSNIYHLTGKRTTPSKSGLLPLVNDVNYPSKSGLLPLVNQVNSNNNQFNNNHLTNRQKIKPVKKDKYEDFYL